MTKTPTHSAIMRTDLPLPGRRQGKVRDIYEATLGNGTAALLIIASDRISAFGRGHAQRGAGQGGRSHAD